jgi:hypothetical protein
VNSISKESRWTPEELVGKVGDLFEGRPTGFEDRSPTSSLAAK